MHLRARIEYFQEIFDYLQSTNSTNEKREIIDTIPCEVRRDFDYILETLAGKHPIGWTFSTKNNGKSIGDIDFADVHQVICFLEGRKDDVGLSHLNCKEAELEVGIEIGRFIEPIVNRTLKLGIGPSVLPKGGLAPMLAKSFTAGKLPNNVGGFYLTEKLDGNRCIAWFDGADWVYQSRSGKRMNVEFDMSNLPTDLVYDGEVLSPEQVEMSECITEIVTEFAVMTLDLKTSFNSTSGLINQKGKNKNLVYNIFDIIDDNLTYAQRRIMLTNLRDTSYNVRILPVLGFAANTKRLAEIAPDMLGKVVAVGGEGLMINASSANYEHKRSGMLLKYKLSKTLDMKVLGTYAGKGKYEGQIGGLTCSIKTDEGNLIVVDVGSGLSDKQRIEFLDDNKIKGKIVEVEYFSLSQNADYAGTNFYSLRFPRLKRIRDDKTTTSEF